jgi:hypothetical protein
LTFYKKYGTIFALNYDSNIPYNLIRDENFIPKRRGRLTMRLADVKGSELARAIDPNLATVNLFAADTPHFEGCKCVYSEKILGDRLIFESLPNPTYAFPKDKQRDCFIVDLLLKNYLSYEEFKSDKAMQKDFINQWLLAVSLGILDYWHKNNFPCFKDEKDKLFIGKAFDFECCMHIINDEDIHNANHHLFKSKGAFEKGLSAENAKYLRNKHPETSEEFFDKLLAVDVDSICDFTKIKARPFHKGMASLSAHAIKGYKKRFRMLADQYAKGKETE